MNATKSAKSRKTSKPAELTVSLCLAINHVVYQITPIAAEDPDVIRAWRLEKAGPDGDTYDVATTIHGDTCSCGDFIFRHEGMDAAGCKHIVAAIRVGLLPGPVVKAPAPRPTPIRPIPDPMADAWIEAHPLSNDLAPVVSCCEAIEAIPCVACTTAPDSASAAPDALPGEMVDPNDSQSDANLWGDETDAETCELGPDPAVPATNPCCDPDDATWCLECANSHPSTWGEWTDQDVWVADEPAPTPDPDPVPEGDEDHLLNAIPESYEPTDDERAEVAAVYAEMDAQRHLDRSDRLTLAELVDLQADFYRSWNSPVGAMLSAHMEALALQVRLTSATTPAELEARRDSLEEDARDTWRAIGYEEGRRAGAVDCFA